VPLEQRYSAGMPRRKRIALGGYVYHVLNRANGRLKIFKKHGDFEAFEKIIAQGLERFSMRLWVAFWGQSQISD